MRSCTAADYHLRPAQARHKHTGDGRAGMGRLALQSLVALAVVAATFLDPGKAAIGSSRLIGPVLVKTRVHPRLAGLLLGVCGRDGCRKYRVTFDLRRSRFC